MKTKITLLTILFATGLSLQAQIPNPGFETWTAGDPVGWSTYNSFLVGSTAQSSGGHSGSSAVRLNAINYFGTTLGGFLIAGPLTYTGFPISAAPAALHGWYKFQSSSSTEYANVVSSIMYQGTATAAGGTTIITNTSVFTEFVFNFFYSGPMSADTANILVSLGSSDSLRTTTYFILDDLAFGAATGIQELSNTVMLEPCSPNPATHFANIIYRIPGHSTVNLAIYDLVGARVINLLDDTEQNAGRYKIPADVSALPAGIYLYRLNVNGQQFTQKLVVSK